jgi:hypothetical protein
MSDCAASGFTATGSGSKRHLVWDLIQPALFEFLQTLEN